MANVRIESVQFSGLINIKGRSRSTSQISKKDAEAGQLIMTEVDGHTLRIESPLGVQRIPLAQVKSSLEAPPEPEAKGKGNAKQ